MPKVEMKLITPAPVNFLRADGVEEIAISIADIPDDVLREIAVRWGDALVERAKQIREAT